MKLNFFNLNVFIGEIFAGSTQNIKKDSLTFLVCFRTFLFLLLSLQIQRPNLTACGHVQHSCRSKTKESKPSVDPE